MLNTVEHDLQYSACFNKLKQVMIGHIIGQSLCVSETSLNHPGVNDLFSLSHPIHWTEIGAFLENPNNVLLQWSVHTEDYNKTKVSYRTVLEWKEKHKDRFVNYTLFNTKEALSFDDKIVQYKMFPEYAVKYTTNIDEISSLKFPIYAKPSNGECSIGVQKFDTYEEWEEYYNHYGLEIDTGLTNENDLFSTKKLELNLFEEEYNVEHEFRFIMFRGDIVSVQERVFDSSTGDMTSFPVINLEDSYIKDIMDHVVRYIDMSNIYDFYAIDTIVDKNGRCILGEINLEPYCGNYRIYCVYMKALRLTQVYKNGVDVELKQFLIDRFVLPELDSTLRTFPSFVESLKYGIPTKKELVEYLLKV